MNAGFNTDWSSRVYRAVEGDFELMQRAVTFLRKHYNIEKPDAEDVRWAAEYIKDYDSREQADYIAA